VLEAWFSLFDEHLSEEGVLLALSPAIFQHLCDTWEKWREGLTPAEMMFSVPDYSRLDLQAFMEAKGRFMNTQEGAALKQAVAEFLKGDSEVGQERTGVIELRDLKEPRTLIRLRRFSVLERPSPNKLVRHLSGKTIGLVRQRHTYGEQRSIR
jgi:hypothetical protein